MGAVAPRHFCVAGVALGDIYLRFTWQEWYLATFTVVSRGRCGTCDTYLRFTWQASHLWDWAGSGGALGRRGAAALFCVAGVALGDICFRFTWQVWHLATSAFVSRGMVWRVATSTFVSRGRRCAWRDLPPFHVAGVALLGLGWLWWCAWAPWRCGTFAWQAWHLVTSAFVSRGRCGTWRDIYLCFTWQVWHF